MKVLTKLLLIHWHYFTHELIEFGELNFLTGKNASGKSTIIDAMQLILLGDTSGSFFNKAANGKGNRTLKGYLLGELGDDEDSGFRYLRSGRFTSYIAMEFYNEDKNRYFTAGCCFDTYSENDNPRLFFLYDGKMHPKGFLSGKTPMDITALRLFLKEFYPGHHETTDVGKDFRTKLYGKLGGLRDRFAGLLKKAVSFNPNVDIQKFISDFVCDNQQTVDVSGMQENIRSYKRLEEEASVLQARIDLLQQIVQTHENFIEATASETLYSFLVERASADMKAEELHLSEALAQNHEQELGALTLRIEETDRRLAELRKRRDTLNAELSNDAIEQTLRDIDRQIAEKEQRILNLRNEHDKAMAILNTRIAAWRSGTEGMAKKIDNAIDVLQAGLTSRIGDIHTQSSTLLEQIALHTELDADMFIQSGEASLTTLSEEADNLKSLAIALNDRLRDEQTNLAKQRVELMDQQRSLESGIYPFPQDALDLKGAVISRLRALAKKDVNVRIVAEVSEIKNERWRNAIEGYLNTQKFYVIVPQEYFSDALYVFNKIKRDKKLYGTGIVHIEKLRRLSPLADHGSLAEEIETLDNDVRLFLDFTLGRVIRCDDVQSLRRYQKAITDEGVLYQNFVVRALNPKTWSRPAIGQGAIQRQLSAVKSDIAMITEQITYCSNVITGLSFIKSLPIMSGEEIQRAIQSARNMLEVPTLQEDLRSLNESREDVDTSSVDLLRIRIATLEDDIASQDGLLRRDAEAKGGMETELRRLREELIPRLINELQAQEASIASTYEESWVSEIGTLRYHRELSLRGKATQIASAFPRELSRARNTKDNAWEALIELRRKYNEKFKMGYDIKAPANEVYDEAWIELSDNQLPVYQTRIADAEAKAFEQFQEDFLNKLRSNIKSAQGHINDLNDALRGASFGEDTYRFRIIPKQEYRRFYDMIIDEMVTFGGYNLMSGQFNDKYKDEIADLFAIITGADDSGGGSSEYEKRIQEYTDFRTYLAFDMEVQGLDGESQRLSKTIYKKSGGETQTPFYIAVLASFAQLYRTGREKTYTTSRLIIFDEAFAKMDGERILLISLQDAFNRKTLDQAKKKYYNF